MERYTRNSRTISGRLHDEMVMMDIEQGRYFSLNNIATRVWDLLENPLTPEEICIHLADEYEVEMTKCRAEVGELLKEMERLALVKIG